MTELNKTLSNSHKEYIPHEPVYRIHKGKKTTIKSLVLEVSTVITLRAGSYHHRRRCEGF